VSAHPGVALERRDPARIEGAMSRHRACGSPPAPAPPAPFARVVAPRALTDIARGL